MRRLHTAINLKPDSPNGNFSMALELINRPYREFARAITALTIDRAVRKFRLRQTGPDRRRD
jgi:hypothetical protein